MQKSNKKYNLKKRESQFKSLSNISKNRETEQQNFSMRNFKNLVATMIRANCSKVFRQALQPIRIHDLRHSHASLLIHNGFPITLISKRLGHKLPDITLKVYSHMYKESGAKVAQFLQDTLVSQSVVKGNQKSENLLIL